MKIEKSQITKLLISDLERLDPITVFLEDLGSRACPIESDPDYRTGEGKITINCHAQSWSAYWGGMGRRNVMQFVAECDWHYVLNCLNRGISDTHFTGAALVKLARRCVLDRRRSRDMHKWEGGPLYSDEARTLWNQIDDLRDIETSRECWNFSPLLTELFGDEWHYPVGEGALEENHEFTYLRRIVEAVQAALREQIAEGAKS